MEFVNSNYKVGVPGSGAVDFFPCLSKFLQIRVSFFLYVFLAYVSEFLSEFSGYQDVGLGGTEPAVSKGICTAYFPGVRVCPARLGFAA